MRYGRRTRTGRPRWLGWGWVFPDIRDGWGWRGGWLRPVRRRMRLWRRGAGKRRGWWRSTRARKRQDAPRNGWRDAFDSTSSSETLMPKLWHLRQGSCIWSSIRPSAAAQMARVRCFLYGRAHLGLSRQSREFSSHGRRQAERPKAGAEVVLRNPDHPLSRKDCTASTN